MPLDGLTMGYMVREAQVLVSGRIDRVSQPEKDMIVLVVRAQNQNFRLLMSASPALTRFHLTAQTFSNPPEAPMFCMLMRKYLLGGRIMEISQLFGDRLVKIVVDNRDELGESGARELYFEAMGRHSNLTLVMNGTIIDSIRHVGYDMSRVRRMLPGLPFEMPPAHGKICYPEADAQALRTKIDALSGSFRKALQDTVSGLSPQLAKELTLRFTSMENPDTGNMDLDAALQKAGHFFTSLPDPAPVVLEDDTRLRLDYFPFPYYSHPQDHQKSFRSLSDAMDAFYTGRDRIDRMTQKSASLKKMLKTALERDEKKLALQESALLDAQNADDYRLRGELLSAQLYLVPKGAKQVELDNYYDENGGKITVLLDEALTPAQNAQHYFKKYRKAMAARKTASEQKQKTLEEIRILEEALNDIQNCETNEDLSDIRQAMEQVGIVKKEKSRVKQKHPPESKPYVYYSSDGILMLVGKNSVQNERLVRDAHGDDLWLHAKDMPGSHVLVHPDGKPITDKTLLEAARLAAFYSKGHGQGVPVDYTLRKYVKKPSGTPTGFVIFTNNKTLLIDTNEAQIRQIRKE